MATAKEALLYHCLTIDLQIGFYFADHEECTYALINEWLVSIEMPCLTLKQWVQAIKRFDDRSAINTATDSVSITE